MNIDFLRQEYEKVWHEDTGMINHCMKKAAEYVILPDGSIIVIQKQGIEKSFCFGESGYDAEAAAAAAAHARTSEDYFRQENMKCFKGWIQDITESMNRQGPYRLIIFTGGAYTGQDADCRLRTIGFARLYELIEACGNFCRLEELPGRELILKGQSCRVATKYEHALLLNGFRRAAKAHEKKINTYLKRYGLSKVSSWTYWRDA